MDFRGVHRLIRRITGNDELVYDDETALQELLPVLPGATIRKDTLYYRSYGHLLHSRFDQVRLDKQNENARRYGKDGPRYAYSELPKLSQEMYIDGANTLDERDDLVPLGAILILYTPSSSIEYINVSAQKQRHLVDNRNGGRGFSSYTTYRHRHKGTDKQSLAFSLAFSALT